MWWMLSALALATGVPARPTLVVRDADCGIVATTTGDLYVTYDMISGVCVPRPDGHSCSWSVERSLDTADLVVKLAGCDEPLPGSFVEAGRCGEAPLGPWEDDTHSGLPLWRFSGQLHPGRRHHVGLDDPNPLAAVEVPGTTNTPTWCPPPSPPRNHRSTPVVHSPAAPPQWGAFPEGGFSVVDADGGARIAWSPGRTLQQWALHDADAVLQSAVMPRTEAERVLAGTTREPTGLSIRYQVTAYREHHEGYDLRRTTRCERILEEDLTLTLLPSDTELSGTVALREPAAAPRCDVPQP